MRCGTLFQLSVGSFWIVMRLYMFASLLFSTVTSILQLKRPAKGSLSESRAFKATIEICKEMLECCTIISDYGEPLFDPEEKSEDCRKVISFGALFQIYTVISDKLVGMLLRARKHKLVDFEGEVLFQRRDDHVPIILLKPMAEIRQIFAEKIRIAQEGIKANEAYDGC